MQEPPKYLERGTPHARVISIQITIFDKVPIQWVLRHVLIAAGCIAWLVTLCMYIYAPVRSSCPILLSYLVRVPVMPLEAEDMTYDDLKEPFVNNKIRFLRGTSLNQKSKLFRFFGLAGVETIFFNISWTARPNFRFSGGGGSVCVVFFWARNTILFSKEWTNIIYCILFKETCIKACCTVVSERATAYWRIPFQNNAIFPARNTILLRMAIPCIAVYYRHITLFQRDCCI